MEHSGAKVEQKIDGNVETGSVSCLIRFSHYVISWPVPYFTKVISCTRKLKIWIIEFCSFVLS